MMRIVLLSWLYLGIALTSKAQSVDCANIGFETGSFQGWERWTGEVPPYISPLTLYLQPGTIHPLNGQPGHVITQLRDGYDPKVKERIPVVAPGSQHSVRIGDLQAGGYVDQLRTTFIVPIDKPLGAFAESYINPHHISILLKKRFTAR